MWALNHHCPAPLRLLVPMELMFVDVGHARVTVGGDQNVQLQIVEQQESWVSLMRQCLMEYIRVEGQSTVLLGDPYWTALRRQRSMEGFELCLECERRYQPMSLGKQVSGPPVRLTVAIYQSLWWFPFRWYLGHRKS
jgi:hypothetical protein